MKQSFTTDGYSFSPCCPAMGEMIAEMNSVRSSASLEYLCDGMYIVQFFDPIKKDYVEILRGRYCPACGAKLQPEEVYLSEFKRADKILGMI